MPPVHTTLDFSLGIDLTPWDVPSRLARGNMGNITPCLVTLIKYPFCQYQVHNLTIFKRINLKMEAKRKKQGADIDSHVRFGLRLGD